MSGDSATIPTEPISSETEPMIIAKNDAMLPTEPISSGADATVPLNL